MDCEPYDRHWIRLRGPWRASWIEDGTPQPATIVKLPAPWSTLSGNRRGTVRLMRRFQTPTNLDPDERVCLTILAEDADIRCTINDASVAPLGSPLGEPDCWPAERFTSFDITDHLESTNRLMLEVTSDQADSSNTGLHHPVLLEIISLAAQDDD